jgi:hypothetical protein
MKRITSLLLAIVLFAGLVLIGAPTAHAASEMVTSDALVEILKKEEGFSAKPYWDYAQYTVGYGTRCPDDMFEEYSTNGITEEDAELLLRNYAHNAVALPIEPLQTRMLGMGVPQVKTASPVTRNFMRYVQEFVAKWKEDAGVEG